MGGLHEASDKIGMRQENMYKAMFWWKTQKLSGQIVMLSKLEMLSRALK